MKETVTCLICGKELTQLSSHLKSKHNMTGNEYREKFPGASLMSELLIYNNSGKNGSNWQGGKITLVCEQCGEEYDIFSHEEDSRRFCNIECKKLWMFENKKESILICDQCGNEFIRQDSSINDGKHFCSKECAKEGMIGENGANWQGGKITLVCDWCGDEFDRYKSQINDYENFCSPKCHGKWISKNLVGENSPKYGIKQTEETKKKIRDNHPHLTYEKSPHWKGGSITLICKQCGDDYDCPKCRVDISQFCSVECSALAHSGENAPQWRGGISVNKYCHLFNNKFKEKIREFYNRQCFLCGELEDNNGRKLSIHHVNYDKNCLCGIRCEFIPLCQSCHSKTNFNRNYWEDTIMCYLYPERYFMVVL